MKGAPGYVALVLDEKTRQRLTSIAIFKTVRATHVTMAYRPAPDVYSKYVPLLGKFMDFEILGVYFDDCCQAAAIDGVPTENFSRVWKRPIARRNSVFLM